MSVLVIFEIGHAIQGKLMECDDKMKIDVDDLDEDDLQESETLDMADFETREVDADENDANENENEDEKYREIPKTKGEKRREKEREKEKEKEKETEKKSLFGKERRRVGMIAKTTLLNDDLALVGHVFTDKTGTLTENMMRFISCSAAGLFIIIFFISPFQSFFLFVQEKSINFLKCAPFLLLPHNTPCLIWQGYAWQCAMKWFQR